MRHINTIQERTVATVDIPVFFLPSELKEGDEDIWIRFEGPMALALVQLDPEKY